MTTETAIGGLQGLAAVDDEGWSALESLSRHLRVPEGGLQQTLDRIVELATEAVGRCDYAGVNLVVRGKFRPQAITGEPPRLLDDLQERTGTGPCIDAARTQTLINIADLDNETRWPDYIDQARNLGVTGMVCAPLWVDDQQLGSVSLYSVRAPFGEYDERVATLFAAYAALALSDAQRTENLRRAMANRDVIGQAKGILMERRRLTADGAFAELAKASQRVNQPLIRVAQQLVDSGELV